MKTRTIAPALLVLAAACSGGPDGLTGPSETVFVSNGLEQQLRVETDLPWDASGEWFQLTSRLVNRGDAPVEVLVTACTLAPGRDLRTRAQLTARAIPTCAAEEGQVTLAPGEESGTVAFTGAIEGRGRYTFRVRHARDPEMWGEIEVVTR